MQKYKSNITSTSGAAIRGVPVLVIAEDGNNAALFLDRAGTVPAPNPLTTGPDGVFYFYAVNGRYSLRTTVDGVTITDDDVVLMMDPEEITVAGPIAEAVAAAQAAATAAEFAVEASGIPELVAAAQNAVVDANNAVSQASTAASNAAISKTGADSARDAAVVAKNAAEAALDSFDDRYLGQKPADPATDNDGGPLLVGALYFRTTAPTGMKVWTGTTWDDTYANLSSKFDKTGGDISGNVNLPSLNGGPIGGMRNRIINGCFRVAQRPAAVLAKNTSVYGGADRFFSYVGGFATVSGQTAQQTTSDLAFSSSGFDQFMTLTTTGTGTVVHGTRLESRDVFDLSGKTITVKVNVFQDIGNVPVYLKLSKANAKDDFSAVTQVAQSAGASIPVGGTGTVTLTTTLGAADAANGLQVEVLMGNVGAVTNKNYVIANFSLELGTVATPFEHRPYGLELELCSRYCQLADGGFVGAVTSGSVYSGVIGLHPPMRAAPTAVVTGNVALNGFPGSPSLQALSVEAVRTSQTASGTTTDGYAIHQIRAEAEL